MHGEAIVQAAKRCRIPASTPVYIRKDADVSRAGIPIGYTVFPARDADAYTYYGITKSIVQAHQSRYAVIRKGMLNVPINPRNRIRLNSLVTYARSAAGTHELVPMEPAGPAALADSRGLALLSGAIGELALKEAIDKGIVTLAGGRTEITARAAVRGATVAAVAGVAKTKTRLGVRTNLEAHKAAILDGINILLREADEYKASAVGRVTAVDNTKKIAIVSTSFQ